MKETDVLQRQLEHLFFPLKYQVVLHRSVISDLCGQIRDIMDKYRMEAMVSDGTLAYFGYHAMHPEAVVVATNRSDRAAYEAAKRAIMIHQAREKKKQIVAR